MKAVLRAGGDPERADSEGTTPLYWASVNGEADIARLLLAAGASPDTESSGLGAEGTPLCAAACWGHTETVRELLAHGADPNLREDHGTGWAPWTGQTTAPIPKLPRSSPQRARPPARAALHSRAVRHHESHWLPMGLKATFATGPRGAGGGGGAPEW